MDDVLTVHPGRVARHVAAMVADGPDVVEMGVMAMNRARLASVSLADGGGEGSQSKTAGESETICGRCGVEWVLKGGVMRVLMDDEDVDRWLVGMEGWRDGNATRLKRALQPLLFWLWLRATRKPKIPKNPTVERVKMRCVALLDSRRAQQQPVTLAHRLSSTCNAIPTTRLERRDATLRSSAR